MNKLVFINLPVKDLPSSRVFFESLGYCVFQPIVEGISG